jgi:hypothetical protein
MRQIAVRQPSPFFWGQWVDMNRAGLAGKARASPGTLYQGVHGAQFSVELVAGNIQPGFNDLSRNEDALAFRRLSKKVAKCLLLCPPIFFEKPRVK